MDVVEENLQVPTQKKGNDEKLEDVTKYNSDLVKYMKADSTAMVLITNHLSDATIQYRCCRLRNSADFMKFGRSWSNCVKVKSHSKNCKK